MSKTQEALKLALEALEGIWNDGLDGYPSSLHRNAITALREALAEQPAQQEPVAVVDANDDGYWADILPDRNVKVGQFLYTTPPHRKPLTSGEIYTAYITATNQTLRAQDERLAFSFARAIEAAHGITGEQK